MLSKLRSIVQFAQIFSISRHEVIAMENISWIGYAMKRWKKMPYLFYLSRVFDVGIASHLTTIIMDALINEGGLTVDDIAGKEVCFGADGVSTFQWHKTRVTT